MSKKVLAVIGLFVVAGSFAGGVATQKHLASRAEEICVDGGENGVLRLEDHKITKVTRILDGATMLVPLELEMVLLQAQRVSCPKN